jgi:hypothetical protein
MFDLIDCLIDTLEFVSWTLVIVQEVFEYTKRDNQNPKIEEEQRTQWPKEKVQHFFQDLFANTQTHIQV